MIGFLKGTTLDERVVLTADGVGWVVHTPAALEPGAAVELWITTRVREDAISLYGFESRVEQDCFSELLRVRNVGPGAALGILGTLGAPGLASAVLAKDAAALTKAPGVGSTTATRIINEITLPEGIATEAVDGGDEVANEVQSALVDLGFAEESVAIAVPRARQVLGDGAGVDELLAEALAVLRGDR